MVKLTKEEKYKRQLEAKRAERKWIKENAPNRYQEILADNRENFKQWYYENTIPGTNIYPRRTENLERKERMRSHDKIVEQKWRDRNREFIRFSSYCRYRGYICTKAMWVSWGKLSVAEQEEVLQRNPMAPGILRERNMILRRKVHAPDTTSRGEVEE